jgi:lactoylglutathione lyase
MFYTRGMRLGYTILYVREVPAAVDFYERAFGLERRYVSPEGHYGELETGDTTLAFVTYEQASAHLPGGFRRNGRNEKPGGFEVALVTDDIDSVFARAVAAGAAVVAEPAQKPWGQTVGYLRDVDGVIVELCSEPEPEPQPA